MGVADKDIGWNSPYGSQQVRLADGQFDEQGGQSCLFASWLVEVEQTTIHAPTALPPAFYSRSWGRGAVFRIAHGGACHAVAGGGASANRLPLPPTPRSEPPVRCNPPSRMAGSSGKITRCPLSKETEESQLPLFPFICTSPASPPSSLYPIQRMRVFRWRQ